MHEEIGRGKGRIEDDWERVEGDGKVPEYGWGTAEEMLKRSLVETRNVFKTNFTLYI